MLSNGVNRMCWGESGKDFDRDYQVDELHNGMTPIRFLLRLFYSLINRHLTAISPDVK